MGPILGNFTPNYIKLLEMGPQKGRFTSGKGNLCGLEPQLIKLEFIIYLPKLKVSRACRPSFAMISGILGGFWAQIWAFYFI